EDSTDSTWCTWRTKLQQPRTSIRLYQTTCSQKPVRVGEQSKGVQRKDDEERYPCKPPQRNQTRSHKCRYTNHNRDCSTRQFILRKNAQSSSAATICRRYGGQQDFRNAQKLTVRLQPSRGLKRDQTVESEQKTQREIQKRIEADVVLKVFLNGCDYATDQFVSVCLSVVNINEEEQKQDVRQNIPEAGWLFVSVYLNHPDTDENAYRRDFRMKFSPAVEK
ncbi:uncharacterized protein LOC142355120, partial [Convolutriloba macropyga]|uniref:uncharacterized protein LOC142355120 n=1 Tax=Convolutriloba macropyga TaxID=536237 RepID=UPI003F526745